MNDEENTAGTKEEKQMFYITRTLHCALHAYAKSSCHISIPMSTVPQYPSPSNIAYVAGEKTMIYVVDTLKGSVNWLEEQE